MNHKQLLALFLCFVMIFSSNIVSIQKEEIVNVKNVSSNTDEYTIENIKEDTDEYSINIFYPVTKFESINDEISKRIEEYKNDFLNTAYISDEKSLIISFENYSYNDYISFKFNVKSSTGITHDLTQVFTITYNKDTILELDDNVIEKLYLLCGEKLKANEKIIEYSNDKWLEDGLKNSKDAFKNFILTKNGITVIFNPCTVAPYVAGIIEIEVGYDELPQIFE